MIPWALGDQNGVVSVTEHCTRWSRGIIEFSASEGDCFTHNHPLVPLISVATVLKSVEESLLIMCEVMVSASRWLPDILAPDPLSDFETYVEALNILGVMHAHVFDLKMYMWNVGRQDLFPMVLQQLPATTAALLNIEDPGQIQRTVQYFVCRWHVDLEANVNDLILNVYSYSLYLTLLQQQDGWDRVLEHLKTEIISEQYDINTVCSVFFSGRRRVRELVYTVLATLGTETSKNCLRTLSSKPPVDYSNSYSDVYEGSKYANISSMFVGESGRVKRGEVLTEIFLRSVTCFIVRPSARMHGSLPSSTQNQPFEYSASLFY